MFLAHWFAQTLRQYPEIAIFLVLALGYYFGKFTFRGIGLGSVTATLLAGVLIGQLGIAISQPLKATVFLMFLFAVGYGVGPQFVRGIAKDGVPQAIFSVVQCLFCLLVPYAIVKIVGYNLGYGAGLYSGSQTISAAMGLSTDAINRLGLPVEQAKALLDSMPVAYAVSYMAYAGIAGVPPQVGLYAAMAGMLVYAVFKTSRQLAVTPTSSSAAMLAALVARMAVGDSARYAPLASFIFLAGGIFKLGSVSEFISKPVLKGFVFGLGLTMARVSDGVRDLLTRSGFLERLGNDRILSGVDIAVDAFLKASPPSTEQPISFAQTHA